MLRKLTLGPLLAMDKSPGLSCFSVKFSSANFSVPYIVLEPVPLPLMKSPPWIIKFLIYTEISGHAETKCETFRTEYHLPHGGTCILCSLVADHGCSWSRQCRIDESSQRSLAQCSCTIPSESSLASHLPRSSQQPISWMKVPTTVTRNPRLAQEGCIVEERGVCPHHHLENAARTS